ncbi:MAG TPA: HD domain-containing phosphohydrolase [Longimicrobiaceae bacterium]|nr:HD domain-containing phosphohydrolase [Longimicrobiaceae bacterium]
MPLLIAPLLEKAAAQVRAGLWPAAVLTYEEAWRKCLRAGDVTALLEVIRKLGHCYRQAGERELAEECFGLALEVAERHGNFLVASSALNGLAILFQAAGDIAGAEQHYLRARDLAVRVGDEELTGYIEQNLGTIANIRGNLEEAHLHYVSGLEHLRAAGDERGAAGALNNLGMLHIDMGRLSEAEVYFDESLAVCEKIGDVVTASYVHINRAELFLALGQPDRARASCDEGFEIASRLNDQARRAEALKVYGTVYRETGKLHLAEIHLVQAVEIAAERDKLLEAETQRELSLVLRAQGRNREALQALNRSHTLFVALQAKSDQADITQRITQLESDFLSLVRFWGESIEAKDRYTSGHCERVADYACRIAHEVGLEEREIVWFRMGAFLHDLGKTEVPEEILNKPGRLTEEERLIMERHTIIGDEMLAPVEFPWDIRPMVRSHHERWDGQGYPDRLERERIPLSARILRIADVFDALTTARSYRRPLTPEEAFEIMEKDDGSFDPALFEIFRRLFPELVETAREAADRAVAESSSVALPPSPPPQRSTRVV